MKLRRRGISVFSLSALDLFAMTMGCFVLLVVVLMPYYRQFNDARAAVDSVKEDTQALFAEIDRLNRRAAALEDAAAEAERREQALAERAAQRAGQIEAKLLEARLAEEAAGQADRKVSVAKSITRSPVAAELDLVFVIDTTGSMENMLTDLGESLASIIRILRRLIPSLRVGFVAYQDRDTGAYVTKRFGLTRADGAGLRDLQRFVLSLRPAPLSGETPTEAVRDALAQATDLDFRLGARQQLILIGDARPHPDEMRDAMAITRRFVAGSDKRAISSLFVTTPAFLRYGQGDDKWFQTLADAGFGEFVEHRGRMIESILLSVLER